MIIPHHTEHLRAWSCTQENGSGRPHVIKEDLFRGVLIRERKRSDRSNQPLGLLLLDMTNGVGVESSSLCETVVEALAAAKREMDVLKGLTEGKSNKEIARDLDIMEPTVKLHMKTLFRKLEVSNRTQAAMVAQDAGLF